MQYLLAAMFLFASSCSYLQVAKEDVDDSLGESSVCRNYFFQNMWGNEKVPACPDSEGLVLLPATYPPAQIFLGYAPQPVHVQFLRDLIEKLAETSPRPQLIITVPRLENDEAYRLYKKYLEPPFSSFVRFVSMPSDESLWMQDYMEVAVSTVSGRGTILDLPYQGREGESIPAAMALNCQMGLIPQGAFFDKKKIPPGNGDFGGNIEAMPGNFILAGDELTSTTQEILEVNLSQDIVKVKTSWGEPGHIDEIFSVVPDKTAKAGACDYALLYASPKLAMDILKSRGLDGKTERLSPPIPEGEESIPVVERVDFEKCFAQLKGDLYKQANAKLRKNCEELIKANETYAGIIDEGLGQVVEALVKRSHCTEVKTIPMPLLFGPEKLKGKYGAKDDYAMSINPNPVNVISLGPLVVSAKQVYAPFQEDVSAKYKSLGLDTQLIDGSYVHYLRGGIHCSSNVVRMCRPQAGESTPAKAK